MQTNVVDLLHIEDSEIIFYILRHILNFSSSHYDMFLLSHRKNTDFLKIDIYANPEDCLILYPYY